MKKKVLMIIAFAVSALVALAATPTVSNVTAKQRYPWNGNVDITYTLTGDVMAGLLTVTASNRASAATATPSTTLTTDSRVRIG